jgi:hypothetical protein
MAAESNENVVVDAGELAHHSVDDIGAPRALADLNQQLEIHTCAESVDRLDIPLKAKASKRSHRHGS